MEGGDGRVALSGTISLSSSFPAMNIDRQPFFPLDFGGVVLLPAELGRVVKSFASATLPPCTQRKRQGQKDLQQTKGTRENKTLIKPNLVDLAHEYAALTASLQQAKHS